MSNRKGLPSFGDEDLPPVPSADVIRQANAAGAELGYQSEKGTGRGGRSRSLRRSEARLQLGQERDQSIGHGMRYRACSIGCNAEAVSHLIKRDQGVG